MMYLGDKPVKAIMPLLPNEYQEVEYIESTGTQYIDTGFYANQDTSVKVLVRSNSVANQAFFCSRTGLSKDTYSCFIVNSYIRHDYNNEQKQTSVQAKAGLLYDICAEKNTLKVNGIVSTIAQGTFTASYSMYLGASFDGSITQNYLVGKIYSCQIYDNDILVRKFIPCYRKSDNVIGLYDTVNKSFYTNKGTGTFLKGENKTTTQLFTVPIKKIVRTTNTVMFNGTEDWFVGNAPSFPIGHYGVNGNFKADVKTNKYGVDVICNHYSFSADGRNIHKSMRFAYGVGNRMFFSDKDYPTLDEWKAHLAELANSGNPVTVTYRLSTPVIDGYEY